MSIPPRPSWALRRPRLDALVVDALTRRAVVVATAPAGFGKTTAIADAVRDLGRPTAWVNLDEADRRADRAAQTLLAGVERATGIDGGVAAGSRGDDVVTAVGAAVHALENTGERFVLVVDDGGTALRAGAGQILRLLLERLPAHADLAVIARWHPAIRSERLRVLDRVQEIGPQPLAFTLEETAAYLAEVHGASVDDSTARAVWESTEGWPAAVHLAAVDLRHGADDLPRVSRSIAAYVEQEVLADLRGEDRRRLRDTAVLPQLTPALCDAVLGREGDAALARFVNAGLVVPVEHGGRFRHHGLLRQVLLEELRTEHPAREAVLHGRAATWLTRQGRWHGAVEQALAAGDRPTAMRLLEEHLPELLATGGQAWLRRTCTQVSDADLAERPALLALRLDLALLAGDRGTVESTLATLDEWPRSRATAQPFVRRARATLARLRGDSVDHLRQDPDLRGPVDAVTAHTLGVALGVDGYHDAARRALWHALRSDDVSNQPLRALAILGDLAWERTAAGDLEEGDLLCRRAQRRAEEAGLELPPAAVLLAQAQIAFDRGRPNAARQQALALRTSTSAVHDQPVRVELEVLLANVLLVRGDVAGADRALARLESELLDVDAGAGIRSRLARAHAALRLVLGDHEHAAELHQGLLADAGELAPEDRLIAAQLAARRGDHDVAQHLLRGAAAGTGPRLTIQTLRLRATLAGRRGWVAEAQRLRHEAERLARTHGLMTLHRPTSRPATAAAPPAVERSVNGERRQPPLESLTERELAVLQRLPLWSNGEIAQDLQVSVNTVKSHLKSIYRKLDVDSRANAVRRARAVGVL
ncbi:LuxR C-terminal-related transcriptional regulator [Egicoccus sp. AB-alg2]|uniref:LuxR C-terminal-related transcriptional regulator n=1 Tax=Egicoccus sp. AB-alg2 TaxID=3242693 RepID=UPI00359DC9F9